MRDSLLYQANFKLGILFDIYRNYTYATAAYREAMLYAVAPGRAIQVGCICGIGIL